MKLKVIASLLVLLVLSIPCVSAMQLSYDANGNLVTGDGKYREYNSLNQLSKIYNGSDNTGALLQSFIHHPVEERILAKYDHYNNETTFYFSKNYVRVINSSGEFNITYVYHNGQLIAQNVNGVKTFIHGDHLGSSSVVTDANGDVVERTEYSPLGAVISGGDESKLGYEAKEHDSLVGDTDFHFRKYNPEWGLFTQPDTLIPNVYDPQSLNRYMFERGNPYTNTDSTGHYLDIIVDVGFIAWDIVDLATNEGYRDWKNWAALGADVGFALLPVVAGGGRLVKGVAKSDEALDGAKLVKNRGALRTNLLQGKDTAKFAGKQAHHVFPVKYADEFASQGIDINKYGSMVDSTSHLSNAKNVNNQWGEFFQKSSNMNFDKMVSYANKVEKGWRGGKSSGGYMSLLYYSGRGAYEYSEHSSSESPIFSDYSLGSDNACHIQ